MKILVYTPFRVGSSYICRSLKDQDLKKVTFFRDLEEEKKKANHLLIKDHTQQEITNLLKNEDLDLIITCIRKPTEIFISSFIKNFQDKGFPYYFDKEDFTIQELVDHFLSFEWHEFEWLSNEQNLKQIYEISGVDFSKENFDKNLGYNLIGKTLLLTHNFVFNEKDKYHELLQKIKPRQDSEYQNFVFSNRVDRKDIYKDFKDAIPRDFFDKYDQLDKKFQQKFGKMNNVNRFLNRKQDKDLYFWNFVDDEVNLPTIKNPVCQLTTAEQWEEDDFKRILSDLKIKRRFHRKQWEQVFVIRALEKSEKLKKNKKGLGFACGTELLPSYFASKKCKITASDNFLENSSSGWVKTNQHSNCAESLFKPKYITEDDFKKYVTFKNIDMNNIPKNYFNSFDFCWSVCAMEHIGGIKKAEEFLKNSLRCLKVGGVAVHTTEFNLSSNKDTFDLKNNAAFRHCDIIRILESLGDDFEYEINLTIGDHPLNFYVDFQRNEPDKHLKIENRNFILTCVGLIIKKVK